ncbi:hypothetical protein BLAT2472_40612 [Burkholderia latens]
MRDDRVCRRAVRGIRRKEETESRDGVNGPIARGPVRAGPGNPDPALRAADLVSAARRTFSCFFTACVSQVRGVFYFTARGHYPRNSGGLKRLRAHQTAYIEDSDTVIQTPYTKSHRVRQFLQSVPGSFLMELVPIILAAGNASA